MSNKNFGKKLAIGFLVLFLVEGIAFIVIWRMLSDPSSHLAKDFASWTEHSSSNTRDDATEDFPTEERARQALSRANRVLFLVPDDVESLGIRARAYARLGENELALKDYQKINSLDPDKPLWLGRMAGTLYDLNKKNEAADCYAKAYQAELALDITAKDSPELKYVHWHPLLEQINCYVDLGERKKALELLEKLPMKDKRIDSQMLIPTYLRLGQFKSVLAWKGENGDAAGQEEYAQALVLSSDLNNPGDVNRVRKLFEEKLQAEKNEPQGSSLTDLGNILVLAQTGNKAQSAKIAEARKLYARSIPVLEMTQSNEFDMGQEELFTYRSRDILSYAQLSGDAALYKKTADKQISLIDKRLKGDNTAGFSLWLGEIYRRLPEDKQSALLSMWENNLERIERPEYQEYIAYCRLSAMPKAALAKELESMRCDDFQFPQLCARLYSTAGNTAMAGKYYKKAIEKESNELERQRLKLELDILVGNKEVVVADMATLQNTDPNIDKIYFKNLRWSFAENNFRLYQSAMYLNRTKEAGLYLKRAAALGNYDALKLLI